MKRALHALLLLAAITQSGAAMAQATGTTAGTAATATAATTAATTTAMAKAKATFAGGCFWCVEADFDKVRGVLSTTSGYIGGSVANPSYEQVSSKTTGHTQAVEIVFDPALVSYATLVNHFWRTIDPTTKDRQFCDIGSTYRTAIFTHGAEQAAVVNRSLEELQKTKPFKQAIVTQVRPATTFYLAEAYHQDYYKKNPVRYAYYRAGCGRDARLEQLWGKR
jgi:peptide-methionine (S)-S-oxide reductase